MQLNAQDVLAGGRGWVTMVDSLGQVHELAPLKTIEVKLEYQQSDIPVLNQTSIASKINGTKNSGSMTLYYMSPVFREHAYQYQQTGKITTYTIVITNNDPSSTAGVQKVILENVQISSLILARLDIEADFLDESIDFTFSRFTIPEAFKTTNLI